MKLINKLFGKKEESFDKLYPGLSPTMKIPLIIENHILPNIEYTDFVFLKSKLAFSRNTDSFIQEIIFDKNNWNQTNVVCAFKPRFRISNRNYQKWHNKTFELKNKSTIIVQTYANSSIPNWTKESNSIDYYDFEESSNSKLISSLCHSINGSGLKFLDNLSNWDNIIEHKMKFKQYYDAPDMLKYLLFENQNMNEKALDVSKWFWDYVNTESSMISKTRIKEMLEIQKCLNLKS